MNRGDADEDLDRQLEHALAGGLIVLLCLGLIYVGRAYRWPAEVNLSVTIVTAGGAAVAATAVLARRRARRQIQAHWRSRQRTCHHCGYDLNGLKSPVRCQECGKPHLPRVA